MCAGLQGHTSVLLSLDDQAGPAWGFGRMYTAQYSTMWQSSIVYNTPRPCQCVVHAIASASVLMPMQPPSQRLHAHPSHTHHPPPPPPHTHTQVTEVINTAIRLIGQMKRDWMQTGRRPAGAGLLLLCTHIRSPAAGC
jgi:hypothetical protein